MDEEEQRRRLLVAMEYVLAGLLLLIAEIGFACWLLWEIRSAVKP